MIYYVLDERQFEKFGSTCNSGYLVCNLSRQAVLSIKKKVEQPLYAGVGL
jgi:hypothetical protein